jgi:hypothetical protein
MLKNSWIAFIALSLSAMPQSAVAGPVTVDGVRYGSADAARIAIQKSAEVRLEQTSKDVLKLINVDPAGGKYTVLLPKLEDAIQKYVWVKGGVFKPGNETQTLVAESVIWNIKVKFLALKKIGFIEDVVFVSEASLPSEYGSTDFIVKLQTDFDGKRTPQSMQFRKTEWVISSRSNGLTKVAFTAYGSPTAVNDYTVFSGMRDAVASLKSDKAQ